MKKYLWFLLPYSITLIAAYIFLSLAGLGGASDPVGIIFSSLGVSFLGGPLVLIVLCWYLSSVYVEKTRLIFTISMLLVFFYPVVFITTVYVWENNRSVGQEIKNSHKAVSDFSDKPFVNEKGQPVGITVSFTVTPAQDLYERPWLSLWPSIDEPFEGDGTLSMNEKSGDLFDVLVIPQPEDGVYKAWKTYRIEAKLVPHLLKNYGKPDFCVRPPFSSEAGENFQKIVATNRLFRFRVNVVDASVYTDEVVTRNSYSIKDIIASARSMGAKDCDVY